MDENNNGTYDGMEFFDELEGMFGESDAEVSEMEKVVLTQNLEGFASCFPEWDLHPPIA